VAADIFTGDYSVMGMPENDTAMSQEAQERFDVLLTVVEALAARDFSKRAPVSERGDTIDALAVGLNMLQEELLANTVAKEELEEKVGELERFQRLTVGRELKMAELKKEIAKLEKKRTDTQ